MTQKEAINAIRFLGVDAINKANSGHPGIVLGAAPIVYTLFSEHMNIHLKDKQWINRDRFILSAGHGSMLLYAINHLVGYNISIDDIKRFRQLGNTPGHPEYGHTDGVETTSGPLGQGISNAVGMALAEAHLAARFNKESLDIINHYTYVLCGDGDLQEGVALEAISLAGHLGLGKLIVLFDSNDVQLDGDVELAYSENHKKKFEALGWQYLKVEDANDTTQINRALKKAKNELNKPTLIEVKSIIGFGAADEGTSKVHGSPIGEAAATKLREVLEWPYEPFFVPQDVYKHFKKKTVSRGRKTYRLWQQKIEQYKATDQESYDLLNQFMHDDIKVNLDELSYLTEKASDATRNVSGKVIDHLSKTYLNIIGGSADLSVSTKAKGADGHLNRHNYLARNINFGVREHAMGAIVNGITLHGGLKAFGGAFFVFSDYMKPTLRLAALMHIPSIFVFTHDSIAVGEDGPTHQPVEQLVGLRAIPNLNVIRPADAGETIAAWKIALESKQTPTALILTRQNVPNLKQTKQTEVEKGAYIISPEQTKLDGVLLSAGSEVSLAIEAQGLLKNQGIDVRVVSMPSHLLFEKQTKQYQQTILPKKTKTLAIEVGSSMSWYKYTAHVFGIDTFGLSAPQHEVFKAFQVDAEHIAKMFTTIK